MRGHSAGVAEPLHAHVCHGRAAVRQPHMTKQNADTALGACPAKKKEKAHGSHMHLRRHCCVGLGVPQDK